MVPFKSLGTVSHSHSIATVAVSLAILTQYTNVTDTQLDTAWQQEPRYAASLGCSHAAKTATVLTWFVLMTRMRLDRCCLLHTE